MGFHMCEWCRAEDRLKEAHIYHAASSQDVTLEFDNGHKWEFPHTGLLHYVTSHGYRPPEDFILDVMTGKVVAHEHWQTKGIQQPTKVGYLNYPELETGHVPTGFVEKLSGLVHRARMDGNLRQTRGI